MQDMPKQLLLMWAGAVKLEGELQTMQVIGHDSWLDREEMPPQMLQP